MSSSEIENQPGAWRTLPILILLYALSLLDRQVLNLLVEPLKRDLHLSDFQIGLLQGIVFSVFFGLASLPLGWLADRYPRRIIIYAGVTLWGIAASVCGLVQNYTQLLFARMGVGVGEAALSPAAYSMLADLFRPSRLALALSVLMIGSTVGNGLAIGLGGLLISFAESGQQSLPIIGDVQTWQYVFIVTGLPGLVLGALIFLVSEPKRRDRRSDKSPHILETFRFIKSRKAFFTAHFVGFGLLSVMAWGFVNWLPVYMIREFNWTIAQITLPLALLLGVGSTIGTLGTGWIVDKLFGSGRTDAHMLVYSIITAGMVVLAVVAFQMPGPWLFIFASTPIIMTMILAATAAAALQIVTPNEMRGQIGALFLLVMNGVGLGLGPTLIGAFTDFVFHDETKLGASITLLFVTLGPIASFALYMGRKPMSEAVSLAENWRK